MKAQDYLIEYVKSFSNESADREVYVTLKLNDKIYGFKMNGFIDPEIPIHEDGHEHGFCLGEVDVSADFEALE